MVGRITPLLVVLRENRPQIQSLANRLPDQVCNVPRRHKVLHRRRKQPHLIHVPRAKNLAHTVQRSELPAPCPLRFLLLPGQAPRGKAAPANLHPDPDAEVWGVLYRITRRDLIRLDSTEGVPGRGYRHVVVEAEDRSGRVIPAITYIAQGKEVDGKPSLRYITLLREGARTYGLPETYIRFLDGVEHVQ